MANMLETLILPYIISAYVSYLLAQGFGPLQDLKDYIYNKFKKKPKWFEYLFQMLNCPKCLSFWIGIIYFQAIIPALLTSLTAAILQKILE